MKLINLINFSLILIVDSISSIDSTRNTNNWEQIENYKKYFGFPRFPNLLLNRRSTNVDAPAEPRETPTQRPSFGSNNEIMRIMKELNAIRKLVQQLGAKDEWTPTAYNDANKSKDSFADANDSEDANMTSLEHFLFNSPVSVDQDKTDSVFHEEKDNISVSGYIGVSENVSVSQDNLSVSSAESNYQLLNTIGMIIGTPRKSCPQHLFQCGPKEASKVASIFSVSSASISSSAPTLSMFPGMRNTNIELPKCISEEQVCDGVKDCPNHDDESELRCRCWQEPNHYKCKGMKQTKCIPKEWLCDGVNDCYHGDDEDKSLCLNVTNADQLQLEYICLGPHHSMYNSYKNRSLIIVPLSSPRQVIPFKWKCDGEQDCEKGDDEKFCNPPYPTKVSMNVSSVSNITDNGPNQSSTSISVTAPLINESSSETINDPSTTAIDTTTLPLI